MLSRDIRRVAILGSYLPRACGLATFTNDVYRTLASARPEWEVSVVAVNDDGGPYNYPSEVRFEIDQRPDSYRCAARYLAACEYDVLFVQHEFGLFAGAAGDMLFELLDNTRLPVVTMLHTVLKNPDDDQFRVIRRLVARSADVITMSARGSGFLADVYDVDSRKINVIPHGIPDVPFTDPIFFKDQFGLLGKKVALTFGLLSPGKGIEYAIDALPTVVAEHPDLVYVILGATHPHLLQREGERYRESLVRRVHELEMDEHVRFVNQFVELDELTQYLGAADLYLTPYLNETQITSGTLAYAYGCGNAVISTPYWHAADLLTDGRGRLVPFRDSAAIADAMIDLFDNEIERHKIRKRAFLEGRDMVWPAVGERMVTLLQRAHNRMFIAQASRSRVEKAGAARDGTRAAVGPVDAASLLEPVCDTDDVEINLQHLMALTDDVGLIQHSSYDTPNWHEGYCTDDNVRALLLATYLQDLGLHTSVAERLGRRYRAFVNYALHPESHMVRNFMSFDRRWLEDRGSDDCVGRVAWVLGSCVKLSPDPDVEAWAAQHFELVLQHCADTTSPRSWCFGILGAVEYQKKFPGERASKMLMQQLAKRIAEAFERHRAKDWRWCENVISYDNARVPHALLEAGYSLNEPQWSNTALDALRWLCQIQSAPEGHFRPIGNHGFYERGEHLPVFDQQPLEAWATVSAALAAFRRTGDSAWVDEARRGIEWFLGRNDLRTPIARPETGGCYDGLQFDRVNRNQGAESTLAWLIAATEWRAYLDSTRRRRISHTGVASAQRPDDFVGRADVASGKATEV